MEQYLTCYDDQFAVNYGEDRGVIIGTMAMKKATVPEDFDTFRDRMLLLALKEPPEPAAPDLNNPGALPEIAKSIRLYYTNESENSDKVYTLDIVKEPKWKDTWYVDFSFGKRGKTLRPGRKTKIAVSLIEALNIFRAVVEEKRGEGYTTNVNGKPFSGVKMPPGV